jgi:NTP pyrophosphatase (non-canonical NTP hydrolase)
MIIFDFPRMNFYEKIKQLSENRITFFRDGSHAFYKWSGTYFSHLVEEVAEANWENKWQNKVYLEDELGDVFWDYMCLLQSLKAEGKICGVDEVLERSYNKFVERVWIDGKWMVPWDETKKIQKKKLKEEHESVYGKE